MALEDAGGIRTCSLGSRWAEAFVLTPGPNVSPLARPVPYPALLSVPKGRPILRETEWSSDEEDVFDETVCAGVLWEAFIIGGGRIGGGGASNSSKKSLGDTFFGSASFLGLGDKPHSLKSIGSGFLTGSSGALVLSFDRNRVLGRHVGESAFESDLGEDILELESEEIAA